MAYIVMAYIVIAYIVMAYIVMALVVMAYIVMAGKKEYWRRGGHYHYHTLLTPVCSYGLYSYGPI